MVRFKRDHIKQLITLSSDKIKRLLPYLQIYQCYLWNSLSYIYL